MLLLRRQKFFLVFFGILLRILLLFLLILLQDTPLLLSVACFDSSSCAQSFRLRFYEILNLSIHHLFAPSCVCLTFKLRSFLRLHHLQDSIFLRPA
jgi:hypothetical protein